MGSRVRASYAPQNTENRDKERNVVPILRSLFIQFFEHLTDKQVLLGRYSLLTMPHFVSVAQQNGQSSEVPQEY